MKNHKLTITQSKRINSETRRTSRNMNQRESEIRKSQKNKKKKLPTQETMSSNFFHDIVSSTLIVHDTRYYTQEDNYVKLIAK